MTNEKQSGARKEKPAEQQEQGDSLEKEMEEGKSLAERVAGKVEKKAGKRLEDHSGR